MMNLLRISVLSTLLLASLSLRGQYSEISTLPILLQAAPLIEAIEEEYNTIVKMEYDLIFPRAPKETFRQLTPNRTYTFVAFGQEDRIERVNIRLYQNVGGQWQLISSGKSYTGFSGIEGFVPPENAFYRIEIEALDFIPPFTAGRYGLIIYHD